jgi:hypothetical protein
MYVPEDPMTWHDALTWTDGLEEDAHLPTRQEGELLFTNVPMYFHADKAYWLAERYSLEATWCHDFREGKQYGQLASVKSYARAVRRV